eukprot:UN3316
MESAEQDQDLVVESQLAMKHRYIEQLKSIFRDLDADRSGVITLQEFEERMEDEAFVAYFSSLDLTTDQAGVLTWSCEQGSADMYGPYSYTHANMPTQGLEPLQTTGCQRDVDDRRRRVCEWLLKVARRGAEHRHAHVALSKSVDHAEGG